MRLMEKCLLCSLFLISVAWADGPVDEGGDALLTHEGYLAPHEVASDVGVASALFTPGVDEERKPMGSSNYFYTHVKQIFFQAELHGMTGTEIHLHWFYNGRNMGEQEYIVDKPVWRVVAEQQMQANWTGRWRVELRDGKRQLLEERTFTYREM